MSNKLTAKQEMFCKEYLIDLNATQAAIRAGYSENTAKDIGCENLAKPNIAVKIEELMSKRSNKAQISSETVLNGILDVIDRNKEVDDKTVLKGYELLGKHLKLFTERTENVTHNINEDVTELTTEERKARIKELNEKNKNG